MRRAFKVLDSRSEAVLAEFKPHALGRDELILADGSRYEWRWSKSWWQAGAVLEGAAGDFVVVHDAWWRRRPARIDLTAGLGERERLLVGVACFLTASTEMDWETLVVIGIGASVGAGMS